MAGNAMVRSLPDGLPDGGMKLMGFIADKRGHAFFTNAAGNVGVWQCMPCPQWIVAIAASCSRAR